MRENAEISQKNGFAKGLYKVLGREIQNLFYFRFRNMLFASSI